MCERDLFDHCQKYQPDVILCASNIIDTSFLDVCSRLNQLHPQTKVVALLSERDRQYGDKLIEVGVIGAFLKSETATRLLEALSMIAEGSAYFSPSLLSKLTPASVLANREQVILQMLIADKSDKEIGLALSIAERTVKSHLSRIYVKFGVRTRAGAAAYAVKHNLVDE